MKALIVYDTITGHTRRAAEDIASALAGEGVVTALEAARDMAEWDVADVAIIAVGSPCHAGSVAFRAGVAGPVRSLLKRLEASTLAGKVAGAFSVNCIYGVEWSDSRLVNVPRNNYRWHWPDRYLQLPAD